MPTPYIYGQTPLEKFAIAQRLFLIQQTKVGTGKYYGGPYKNSVITGNNAFNDEYNLFHTRALSVAGIPYTPSYGKGTGEQINIINTYKGVVARFNFDGGSIEDRDARNAQLIFNATIFGLGPGTTLSSTGLGPKIGGQYSKPNIALNTGKIIFP